MFISAAALSEARSFAVIVNEKRFLAYFPPRFAFRYVFVPSVLPAGGKLKVFQRHLRGPSLEVLSQTATQQQRSVVHGAASTSDFGDKRNTFCERFAITLSLATRMRRARFAWAGETATAQNDLPECANAQDDHERNSLPSREARSEVHAGHRIAPDAPPSGRARVTPSFRQ